MLLSGKRLLKRFPAFDLHDKVLGKRYRSHELAKKFGAVLFLFDKYKNDLASYTGAVIERSLEGDDRRAVVAALILA